MSNYAGKYDGQVRGGILTLFGSGYYGTSDVTSMTGCVASSTLVNSASIFRLNVVAKVSGGSAELPISFMVESIRTGYSFMISATCSVDMTNSYTVQWEIVNPKLD